MARGGGGGEDRARYAVVCLQVWRIGLMGHNARLGNVALVLHALEDALRHVGWSGLRTGSARSEL